MRVILVLLLSAALAHADLHIGLVTTYGCHLTQGEGGVWILDVWARQDPEPEYKRLFSIRPKRLDAMKECSFWMDEIQRQLKTKSDPKRRKK